MMFSTRLQLLFMALHSFIWEIGVGNPQSMPYLLTVFH